MVLFRLAGMLRRVWLGGRTLNGLFCAGAVRIPAGIMPFAIRLAIHLYLWIADVHNRIFRVRHIVRDGGVNGHGHRRKAADDSHHQCRAEQDACRNEDDAFCFVCHRSNSSFVGVSDFSSYPEHTTAFFGSLPKEVKRTKTSGYTWPAPADLGLRAAAPVRQSGWGPPDRGWRLRDIPRSGLRRWRCW